MERAIETTVRPTVPYGRRRDPCLMDPPGPAPVPVVTLDPMDVSAAVRKCTNEERRQP
jgi:hypothetical protein